MVNEGQKEDIGVEQFVDFFSTEQSINYLQK